MVLVYLHHKSIYVFALIYFWDCCSVPFLRGLLLLCIQCCAWVHKRFLSVFLLHSKLSGVLASLCQSEKDFLLELYPPAWSLNSESSEILVLLVEPQSQVGLVSSDLGFGALFKFLPSCLPAKHFIISAVNVRWQRVFCAFSNRPVLYFLNKSSLYWNKFWAFFLKDSFNSSSYHSIRQWGVQGPVQGRNLWDGSLGDPRFSRELDGFSYPLF